MQQVRRAWTLPERRLALALVRRGVSGWSRNVRSVPGSPDLAFLDLKVAVFVDGCFWHGCPRHYVTPNRNVARWRSKVAGNRRRDARVDRVLLERGWTVIRAWSCSLEDGRLTRLADSIVRTIALVKDGA